MDSKGQEAITFELLIAVIIMAFVIFIGMIAMDKLHKQQCYGLTEAKLEEMKTTLETVVTQRSIQTINFALSGCYDEKKEHASIRKISDEKRCTSFCGVTKLTCSLLQYSNTDKDGFSITKCLDINPDTIFPGDTRCPPREGWELQRLNEEIPYGTYQLMNKTRVTDTFPAICAYIKTK